MGFPYACRVASVTSPGTTADCSFGPPLNLSTSLKNVLMIGDSVSNGYFLEATPLHNVPELLKDTALVQHAPFSPGSGGAGPTAHGFDCMDV
jgi:hypothetical protein